MESESSRVPESIRRLVTAVRQELANTPDVAFAYLFGSRIKGTARPNSDLDIAIWLTTPLGPIDAVATVDRQLDLGGQLETTLGCPVDVVLLNTAPLDLVHNVLRHGLLVYCRNEDIRHQFYVEHARQYYDLAQLRTIFDRYLLRRTEEGRLGGGGKHHTTTPARH
ncbi:MAG: nucleotidyltransferase domain-containing protein [Limnochordaceae bacterium]|nr:nucleotidyltransferase domain-containing protein [Limnochordaceae bacterium]